MDRKTELETLIERFRGTDLDGLDALIGIAIDLGYAGDHRAEAIWKKLSPQLWDQTQNPWVILKTVSLEKLQQFLADSSNKAEVKKLHSPQIEVQDSWFGEKYSRSPLKQVVYFCMEFMLSESLPIYSGGLGNVAGDQLKAADDLGVPVIGIGLLYQRGYFRQVIDRDGNQQALYPYNDPDQLPIIPFRKKDGEWLRIKVELPGYALWLRVWEARVGKIRLLLLDSNDAANYPAHRSITSELYGGGKELRLQQEMILGICGWRLLQQIGVDPEICHLNEGHSAFVILERAKTLMEKKDIDFWRALSITRPGNLFTTHTAVAAGFDLFETQLMSTYFSGYAASLGLSFDELMSLGRLNPSDVREPFNMAYLAIRGSGAVNGVSQLHGEVSRTLFQPLFPRWPTTEVPIGHVTNGVHTRTWESEAAENLWTKAFGLAAWDGRHKELAENIRTIPDGELWEMRSRSRGLFIQTMRQRLPSILSASGAGAEQVNRSRKLFDPEVLTIGFARRFATYKRPNLLLSDKDRFLKLLNNTEKPVQFVISGKAHPADIQGQEMIKEWVQFSKEKSARDKVVFLSDYDMNLARTMVQGVDVWLNNPRRPWEASGTSGMKVLGNGGLNISTLDGWWNEAYEPSVGWAIGDNEIHDHDDALDSRDANQLYQLLEDEIVPMFYKRDVQGVPNSWISKVKSSMVQLTHAFSAARTVMEYTEKFYIPGATALRERLANQEEEPAATQQLLRENWGKISIDNFVIEQGKNGHLFTAQISKGAIPADLVQVELFAEGINSPLPTRIPMERISDSKSLNGTVTYQTEVTSTRNKEDYTVRIIPKKQGLAVPLESNLIYWQR